MCYNLVCGPWKHILSLTDLVSEGLLDIYAASRFPLVAVSMPFVNVAHVSCGMQRGSLNNNRQRLPR